jgi:hypothetical protein
LVANKYTKLGKTSETLLLSQGLSYMKIPLCNRMINEFHNFLNSIFGGFLQFGTTVCGSEGGTAAVGAAVVVGCWGGRMNTGESC